MKNLQDISVKTIPGNLLLKIDVNAILENTAHDVDGIDVYNEKVEKYLKQSEKFAECKRRWDNLHKEERAVSRRLYYEENKEKIAEYSRQYYEAHKKDKAEYFRRYWEENKEIIAERRRRYREENKEKIAERNRRYRAKKKAERLAALAQTLKNESTESTTI